MIFARVQKKQVFSYLKNYVFGICIQDYVGMHVASKCTGCSVRFGTYSKNHLKCKSIEIRCRFCPKTSFLQVYVNCSKKVFPHLQVCTIYLVNYYIRKLVHESKTFLCSKLKLVKSKFLTKKLPKKPKHVKLAILRYQTFRDTL